jgi:hypothetical protein
MLILYSPIIFAASLDCVNNHDQLPKSKREMVPSQILKNALLVFETQAVARIFEHKCFKNATNPGVLSFSLCRSPPASHQRMSNIAVTSQVHSSRTTSKGDLP